MESRYTDNDLGGRPQRSRLYGAKGASEHSRSVTSPLDFDIVQAGM
jgi:hypothetical protein